MKGKVLFVGFKRQRDSILIGGGIANLRSLRMLRDIFGQQQVDETYILDEAQKRSLWSYAFAVCLFPFNYHNGLTPKKVKDIVQKAQGYDYVFLSTSVLGLIAKKLKENGYKGTIVTHYHNIESIYYDAQMPRWLPGRQFVVSCAAHNDEYGCHYSDKIITLSKRDSDSLAKLYGRGADAIVGVSMEDKFLPVDTTIMTGRRPQCLFLGAYSIPNNEGVLFFVQKVLPHVDINFKVVGRDMDKLKQENACMKAVEVVSNVPDLRPYIEKADFMILPVFAGSGMKIKTCESLMYGKNILGSDESFEGYDLDTQQVGGRCNTPEEYIARLQHFIEHPVTRFNCYSRNCFLKNHSEENTRGIFRTVFDNKKTVEI